MENTTDPTGQDNTIPGDEKSWLDSLPDEIKGDELITKHENVESLVSDYLETKKSIPVVPEEYEFNTPEGVEINQAERDSFVNIAKEAGMTQQQVEALVNFDLERQQRVAELEEQQYETLREEAEKTLKSEWGQEYETNLNMANRAYMQFADDEFKEFNEQTGYANNPVVIRYFHRMAQKLKEADVKIGDGSGVRTRHYDDGTPMLHYPSMQSE